MADDKPLTEEQQAAKYPNSDLARAIAAEKAATAPKPGTTAPKPSTTVPVMGSGLPSALPVIPKGPEISTTLAPFGQGRTMNFAGAGATPRFAGSAQSTQQSTQPGFAGPKPDTFASDREKAKLQEIDAKKWNPEGKSFLQKFGHGLATAGNIAGDIFAPQTMALIPGTQLHNAIAERNAESAYEKARAQEEKPELAEAQGELKGTIQSQKDQAALQRTQIKNTGGLAEHGLKLDENGQIVPDTESEVYKGQESKRKIAEDNQKSLDTYRTSQEDLNAARAEFEKSKNDPNSPAFKQASQRLQMAQLAHDIADQNLQLHENQFQNKLKEQELVKPSGQSVSRGDAAGSALELLPGLEDSVRANAKYFGPIVGRVAKGEINIGNVPPEVQKFYSQLQSFYALQPSVHGFRNAEFVKDFNTFVGNLQTNPDALIAGLEGLRPTLNAVEKSGRTYKHRAVEGAEGKQGNEKDPLGILQ